MSLGRCTLQTDDTVIEKTIETEKHIADWNLSEAIIAAIKAFDAANPTVTGNSSLAKRVREGLQ